MTDNTLTQHRPELFRYAPLHEAKVFMLREMVGLEPEEICKEPGLSLNNYWVTLHRARLRLRVCMEMWWFGIQQTGSNDMRSCRDVSVLVSKSLDVHLNLRERLAVRLHLLMCKHCSDFKKQMLFLRPV